jgi:hypothetical protein
VAPRLNFGLICLCPWTVGTTAVRPFTGDPTANVKLRPERYASDRSVLGHGGAHISLIAPTSRCVGRAFAIQFTSQAGQEDICFRARRSAARQTLPDRQSRSSSAARTGRVTPPEPAPYLIWLSRFHCPSCDLTSTYSAGICDRPGMSDNARELALRITAMPQNCERTCRSAHKNACNQHTTFGITCMTERRFSRRVLRVAVYRSSGSACRPATVSATRLPSISAGLRAYPESRADHTP